MATADAAVAPRDRLRSVLSDALLEDSGIDRAAVDRLGCLLEGRARFEAIVGDPPGGPLAPLPGPFAGLDLPAAVIEVLEELRGALGQPDANSIGAEYATTLAATDREAQGQYVTPTPVAAGLVRWAVDGNESSAGPPRVLDPAVGTGTFLEVAFDVLASREGAPGPDALLEKLIGVDVDPVALHLAGLRLAATAGRRAPDTLALHEASFFDCVPSGGTREPAGVSLPPVDAVVGNPPFLRAEALEPATAHYRRHLGAFGPDGESPWADGETALSRRSDAYVYFVTQATRFLRPGGRLAMVLPTKWLMSAYGEDFRRFLRAHYRVQAVVGYDGLAFDDALVDTALLFAERAPDAPAEEQMRFVRMEGPLSAERIQAAGGDAHPRPASVSRPQRSLTASGSLARHLEAPAELIDLLDSSSFVRLDSLGEVARGTMTGANRFFFVDESAVDRFGIEDRFRRPAVKSLRSIDRPTVGPADVNRWLVAVHPVVKAVGEQTAAGTELESAVTDRLAAAGHWGLLRYVAHAERAGWHEGRTCQSRRVWFDLGPIQAPGAFMPKLLRERVYAIRNAAGAVPSNAIDGIWPASGVDMGALLAVLNASIGKAAIEVTGRNEAGMLQLMTYETASLPTLDVRQLSPATAEALETAGAAYAASPDSEQLRELDRAVHAAFDLSIEPDRLRELARTLKRRRVDGGEVDAVPSQ
jgi:methylase of polypeptide subunit release factors